MQANIFWSQDPKTLACIIDFLNFQISGLHRRFLKFLGFRDTPRSPQPLHKKSQKFNKFMMHQLLIIKCRNNTSLITNSYIIFYVAIRENQVKNQLQVYIQRGRTNMPTLIDFFYGLLHSFSCCLMSSIGSTFMCMTY